MKNSNTKERMNSAARAQWALTLIRLMLGIIFLAHGSQKVFGLFGGSGLTAFVTWAKTLGVPPLLGYLAAIGEFVAGALLLLGIYAELGALLGLALMVGALYLVHAPKGFFIQHGGYEYVLTLMVSLSALIIAGPGNATLAKFRR